MRALLIIFGVICAVAVGAVSFVALPPVVFAERTLPGVHLGESQLSGVAAADMPGVLEHYQQDIQNQTVQLTLRDQTVTARLADIGVTLDIGETMQQVQERSWLSVVREGGAIAPIFAIDSVALQAAVEKAFSDSITPPRNAGLELTETNQLKALSSQAGEVIDGVSFERDVRDRALHNTWATPIAVILINSPPQVLNHEIEPATQFAERLLREGFKLSFQEETYEIAPFTLRRLLRFTPVIEAPASRNYVLGVTLDDAGTREYLATTIAPEINREATDARFMRSAEGKVEQFSVAETGRALNSNESVVRMAAALSRGETAAALQVDETPPLVSTQEDIETLGITTLLATGETDFVGSPRNRIHNIVVGTERYHGLLLQPGEEFSFNEHLGPVDAAHGFKPELVIKHNVTIPEYGGGLCQVSTTAFRAAIYSGLKITQRRNHAYAVRYYGTPGFDATIYPPYTDLRFTNNTPGYILIQARVEGTKLTFDFWGTDDGREVLVEGPTPYSRQSNGAVKATLKQRVVNGSSILIDDTFASNYKSPDLFPKVVTANDPKAVAPTPTPTAPTPSPLPTHAPKPTPAASRTPAPAAAPD